jgi:hypothetical protein
MATPPDPVNNPRRAAQAALQEARRLELQIQAIYEREPTSDELAQAAKVRARIQEAKGRQDTAGLPAGTHVGKVHDPDDPPWASAYYSRHQKTGAPKIDMYTGADGMPRLGNIYPHVHYYEQPSKGEAGAIASLDHGGGSSNHAGRIDFAPGSAAKDIADQLTILRQAIATAGPSAADVQNEVDRLRDALNESRRQ